MELSQGYLTAVGKEINQRVIIGEMLVCTALVSHCIFPIGHCMTYYLCRLLGQREDDCARRSLRLVNGPNNESGRVEVCRFGCWGTVCDEGWDRDDAIVVCRQLGFETASAIPTRGAYFGEGRNDRPISLSQAECTGTSKLPLINCTQIINGINNCVHSQDAGIICHGR